MKILLTTIVVLLSSPRAFSAFNEALTIKQVSDDGESFVFVRKEGPAPWLGITIKDPQTKAMLYEARVIKCSATSCLAQIVKNHSGIKFRDDEEYVHSYNDKAIVYDEKKVEPPKEIKPKVVPPVIPPPPPVEEVKPKVVEPEIKPEVKPVAPPPPSPVPAPVVEKPKPKPVEMPKPKPKAVVPAKKEPEKPSLLDRAIYGSYGSPIGPGFKVGYFKKLENVWIGVNYAKIGSTTSDVKIDGHLLSGVVSYNVYKVGKFLDINILGELGLAKATLDFAAVDPDGPSKDEMTYFLGAAGEAKYTFDRLSVAAKFGLSKAGFAGTYKGKLNEYNNPYGSVLGFLEIGAYYRF